jgi:hypothetical protein
MIGGAIMDRRLRIGARTLAVLAASVVVLVAAAPVATGAATVSKDEYLAQANAICEQGSAEIDAAEAKLGDSATQKQVEAFVTKVVVPNIGGQIAAIRKLGYPTGDRAQLTALFASAERVLARIKKNPKLATGGVDPLRAVKEELSAYGLHSCAGDDPVSIAERFAGTYTGTWKNTTFGSSGSIKVEVAVDPSAKTAKVTTTLGGNVFGAPAPPPETVTIQLASLQPGQPATITSPLFGQLTLSVKEDGTIVADSPDVPSAAITTFHAELHQTATGLDGTYRVALASGTTANGTLTLTHS